VLVVLEAVIRIGRKADALTLLLTLPVVEAHLSAYPCGLESRGFLMRISLLSNHLRSYAFTLAAVLTVALSAVVQSTTIRPLSLDELSRESSEVVHGRVIGAESFWNRNRSTIYSRITVATETPIKGDVAGEVSLLVIGGTVDGISSIVVDAPGLKEGQEVLLFLNRLEDLRAEVDLPVGARTFRLTDVVQGVLTVVTDAATQEKRAVSHIARDLLRDPVAAAQPELRNVALSLGGPEGLPLGELISRIQRIR
jgi:hypothetical protein